MWKELVLLYLQVYGVLGEYVLQVRTLSYSNQFQVISEGPELNFCCDGQPINLMCSDPCDVYFEYCIRPESEVRCTCTNAISDVYVSDVGTTPINFSQSTVLGVSNPLTFGGFDSVQGIELCVTVRDDDPETNSFDFISDYQSNLLLTQLNLGQTVNDTSQSILSSLLLELTLLCAEGYTGDNCETFLQPTTSTTSTSSITITPSTSPTSVTPSTSSTTVMPFTNSTTVMPSTSSTSVTPSTSSTTVMPFTNSTTVMPSTSSTSVTPSTSSTTVMPFTNSSIMSTPVKRSSSLTATSTSIKPSTPSTSSTLSTTAYAGIDSTPIGAYTISSSVAVYTSPTPSVPHTPVDKCAGVNCSGNGLCVDKTNGFTCFCLSGFTGVLCSVELQGDSLQLGGIIGGLLGALLVVILVVSVIVAVALLVRARKQIPHNEDVAIEPLHYAHPASAIYATIDSSEDEYGMIKNVLYGMGSQHERESTVHTYDSVDNVVPPARPTSHFAMNVNEAFDMNPYGLNYNTAYGSVDN